MFIPTRESIGYIQVYDVMSNIKCVSINIAPTEFPLKNLYVQLIILIIDYGRLYGYKITSNIILFIYLTTRLFTSVILHNIMITL